MGIIHGQASTTRTPCAMAHAQLAAPAYPMG